MLFYAFKGKVFKRKSFAGAWLRGVCSDKTKTSEPVLIKISI